MIPLFNDVHVMVFLGIGFILTFIRNLSLTALSFNFLVGSLSVQLHVLGTNPIILENILMKLFQQSFRVSS